jgi:hypothetical protein
MSEQGASYRRVRMGERPDNAVTVSIERGANGRSQAAVWWPGQSSEEASASGYTDIRTAFAAAETARVQHALGEVVVMLDEPALWQAQWGVLMGSEIAHEPIGDLTGTDLSSAEAFELAQRIETERDA